MAALAEKGVPGEHPGWDGTGLLSLHPSGCTSSAQPGLGLPTLPLRANEGSGSAREGGTFLACTPPQVAFFSWLVFSGKFGLQMQGRSAWSEPRGQA